MASVALEGVTKAFPGGVTAVNELNLEVRDREFLVLLGPSGCGKSTTLRLIAGLDECTGGLIRIGERVVNDVSPKNRDISMVFQNYALYPHMTVYKNMAFGLQLRYGSGWLSRGVRRLIRPTESSQLAAKRRGIRSEVEATARSLGIDHLLDRMPRQLSGGERQRVALGRAIVRRPAVFLFDEPLSNLDAQLRLETRRELKELHQRLQTTMVYVTHDQTEALTLGERIAVMENGRLQQLGSPREIYERPDNQFVAGFIGSPPMNLVPGHLRRIGTGWEFKGRGLRVPVASAPVREGPSGDVDRTGAKDIHWPVTLGVRPEHCRAVTDAESAVGCGEVRVVEMVGDAAYVHLRLWPSEESEFPDTQLVFKTGPETGLRFGGQVEIAVSVEKLHLFDAADGRRIATN